MIVALSLLAVCGAIAASLFVPVDVYLEAKAGDGTWARLRVQWLGGRVSHEVSTDQPRPPRDEGDDEPGDPVAAVRNGMRVWESSLRDEIEKLFRELWQRLTLEDVWVHGRLGLGDPADTGMAMALILPIADLANELSRCDVDIEPCYEETALSGDAHAQVRVVPAELIPPLLSFGLSRDNLREMRTLWRERER